MTQRESDAKIRVVADYIGPLHKKESLADLRRISVGKRTYCRRAATATLE